MITTRRGFTMVELMVAMFMLAAVGAAIYAVLINTQRMSRLQAERTDLQDNVRAGGLFLPAELREIGYDTTVIGGGGADPDLIAIATDRVQYRAMRGVGFTCQFGNTEVRVRSPITGYNRTPVETDDILFFVENNPNAALDDEWMRLGISAVDPASTCPDGTPAIRLTLDATAGTYPEYGTYQERVADPLGVFPIQLGGPVRFFEIMEVRLYTADGKSWLGAQSISTNEPIQPVLGPLTDNTGLRFTYYNAADAVVPVVGGNLSSIRTIQIGLDGRTDEPVYIRGGLKVDSLYLQTRVALRNALRP